MYRIPGAVDEHATFVNSHQAKKKFITHAPRVEHAAYNALLGHLFVINFCHNKRVQNARVLARLSINFAACQSDKNLYIFIFHVEQTKCLYMNSSEICRSPNGPLKKK